MEPFTFEEYEKWIKDNFGGWGDQLEAYTDRRTNDGGRRGGRLHGRGTVYARL